MKLVHYSKEPLGQVESKQQLEKTGDWSGKPKGIWVTIPHEYSWKEWCEAEEFRLTHLTHATELVLKPEAKILHLKSPEEIDLFTEKYGEKTFGQTFVDYINWPEVSKEFQGIIISPYQWSRRMTQHTFWYYGWDCASGCIWDANVIECIKEYETPKRKFREEGE